MTSSFAERFGPRVRIRDVAPVSGGSPARLRLEPLADFTATVPVARALMRRGVNGRLASYVSEQLAFGRAVAIRVPHFDGSALVRELADAKVKGSEVKPLQAGDVTAVRKRLGLTQEQFAERFALDVATVRNWEQGRSAVDGAAAVLLKAIARAPEVIQAAAADATACLTSTPLEWMEPG